MSFNASNSMSVGLQVDMTCIGIVLISAIGTYLYPWWSLGMASTGYVATLYAVATTMLGILFFLAYVVDDFSTMKDSDDGAGNER